MNILLENLLQKIPFYKQRRGNNKRTTKKFLFSKYKPHQGEQEKSRRRRQIERGIIK
jgi:hypothetical protein